MPILDSYSVLSRTNNGQHDFTKGRPTFQPENVTGYCMVDVKLLVEVCAITLYHTTNGQFVTKAVIPPSAVCAVYRMPDYRLTYTAPNHRMLWHPTAELIKDLQPKGNGTAHDEYFSKHNQYTEEFLIWLNLHAIDQQVEVGEDWTLHYLKGYNFPLCRR